MFNKVAGNFLETNIKYGFTDPNRKLSEDKREKKKLVINEFWSKIICSILNLFLQDLVCVSC